MAKPAAVYVLYGKRGAVLYVGCSVNPLGRFMDHSMRDYAKKCVRITIKWYLSKELALLNESNTIRKLWPLHNVMGKFSAKASFRTFGSRQRARELALA